MYKDGWKAVTIHGNRMPWIVAGTFPFDKDVWELYNLNEDFSETNDLAASNPQKLEELKKAWDEPPGRTTSIRSTMTWRRG